LQRANTLLPLPGAQLSKLNFMDGPSAFLERIRKADDRLTIRFADRLSVESDWQ
jgi:hypothetical protein